MLCSSRGVGLELVVSRLVILWRLAFRWLVCWCFCGGCAVACGLVGCVSSGSSLVFQICYGTAGLEIGGVLQVFAFF